MFLFFDYIHNADNCGVLMDCQRHTTQMKVQQLYGENKNTDGNTNLWENRTWGQRCVTAHAKRCQAGVEPNTLPDDTTTHIPLHTRHSFHRLAKTSHITGPGCGCKCLRFPDVWILRNKFTTRVGCNGCNQKTSLNDINSTFMIYFNNWLLRGTHLANRPANFNKLQHKVQVFP